MSVHADTIIGRVYELIENKYKRRNIDTSSWEAFTVHDLQKYLPDLTIPQIGGALHNLCAVGFLRKAGKLGLINRYRPNARSNWTPVRKRMTCCRGRNVSRMTKERCMAKTDKLCYELLQLNILMNERGFITQEQSDVIEEAINEIWSIVP